MADNDKALRELRSLDFFMGLFFLAIGTFMGIASFSMFKDPMLAGTAIYSNPGITSLVVGGLLVILGATMGLIGLRGARRPLSVAGQALGGLFRSKSFWSGILVLAIIAFYFFVLWSHTPYWFSTFVFMAILMWRFKAGAWWKNAIIIIATIALVLYFFGKLALVPLPAEPGWLKPFYDLLAIS